MPTPDEWFNQALRDYQAGIFPAGKILDLGRSPYFAFQGWPSKIPILMVQQILRKAVDKHIIDLAGFENLPTRLKSPVAIFESRTVANSFVIVTDLVLEKTRGCRHSSDPKSPIRHLLAGKKYTCP